MSESPRKAGVLIELDQVSRIYHRTQGVPVTALHPLSLQVLAGEFMCLAGPSGSGKTTLLNLMGIIDAPTTGTVTLAGRSTGHLSRRGAALLRQQSIGLVFQEHNLIPVLSAYENIEYVLLLRGLDLGERRKKVLHVLDLVGLGGLADRRPGELSGGQQQRVAVARAIITEPQLVLADEPTASLDSATGEEIIELLHRLNRKAGVSFVFSSHDPRIIHRADRIITLQDGRVISDSPTRTE